MIGNTVYQWAVDSNGRVVSNSEFQLWLQEYKKTHPSNQKREEVTIRNPTIITARPHSRTVTILHKTDMGRIYSRILTIVNQRTP